MVLLRIETTFNILPRFYHHPGMDWAHLYDTLDLVTCTHNGRIIRAPEHVHIMYMYFEIDDTGLGLGRYIYTIFRVFARYTRNEPVDGHI
jgi:hypothetical protein